MSDDTRTAIVHTLGHGGGCSACGDPDWPCEGWWKQEVKRLRQDRDLLVRALREYAADRSDDDIAFDFDAPGARLHEHLRRILSEVPNGSSES